MNFEVVDELATPGCPQCALKHLSAALSYVIAPGNHGFCAQNAVWAAVAKINLAEVLLGYKSHLWYAVGMLQRSEETALARGSAYATVRRARMTLEEKGLAGVTGALRTLDLGIVFEADEMCEAHLYEAARELPADLEYPIMPLVEVLHDKIEQVRQKYFDLPEVTVSEGETTKTKGEPENGYDKEGRPRR